MNMIEALTQSEFWGGAYASLFDDVIGFAVLCVACVLWLSYLREKPPELEKKGIVCAGVVLFVGAFLSRIPAHYAGLVLKDWSKYRPMIISAAASSPKDELLQVVSNGKLLKFFDVSRNGVNYDNMTASALINLFFRNERLEGLEYQRYVLLVNVFSTVVSLVSISIGAFILMRIFKAKHIAPMAIIQIAGLLFRNLVSKPYAAFVMSVYNSIVWTNHLEKDDVNLCGYSGFAYGCFMILIIISYILVTRQQYETFWTKNIPVVKHVLSVIVLAFAYTFLMFIYNYVLVKIGSDNKIIEIAFNLLTFVFLAAVLLYVPKRTYAITRGELQEEFFEVKRKEEVEQYAYSAAQIRAERKYIHDLPAHFMQLSSMAAKIGADEISQYVMELNKNLIESKGEFSTGNAFLDDLLYDKLKQAQQNKINIVFNGVFPNEGVRRIDITTIFHNLVENAVEACKKYPKKREIIITSKIHEDRVYLSFSNPFEQKPQQKRGRFETSKKNKDYHGYGLSNVEKIVKKYDGSFSTRQEDNIFIAEVNLKYKH